MMVMRNTMPPRQRYANLHTLLRFDTVADGLFQGGERKRRRRSGIKRSAFITLISPATVTSQVIYGSPLDPEESPPNLNKRFVHRKCTR